ncbi:CAP domain-containing protein [Allorhizocola rhizosphaerae]|uniref:CAP domain-containing protein n=1 Tax=Allorhizocola rhizosphaerae TaxID=1872709 RepID=UPI0013C2F8D3|nr:CAP domain-containing protein [Allorhizocola rhizosphaerae]
MPSDPHRSPDWEGRALEIVMGSGANPRRLLYLVNRARQAAGLRPLAWSERLALAAERHARDMLERNFYSHWAPEGLSPSDRALAAGYPWGCGENIAWNLRTVGEVHQAWMASEGHRANILNPRYVVLGCGHAGGYWVENFGCSPK